ncbi:hypothetical protein [Mycetohabitans sp. B8]|uniref:hypothetical protein n=1 Tax=Mycetohabitans sp. B8 TaxID=2841845 RepID=UPI001F27F1BC
MTPEIYRENGQPFLLEGNEVGVLLSHGYTGTTSGMRYLGRVSAQQGRLDGPRAAAQRAWRLACRNG